MLQRGLFPSHEINLWICSKFVAIGESQRFDLAASEFEQMFGMRAGAAEVHAGKQSLA
jgi:hypothetical protein